MVQKEKNSSPVVLRLAAVLMILVLLTTGVVSGRYARYVTTASHSDSARVAAFVFDVTEQGLGWQLNLDSLQKPGDQQSFSFKVTNATEAGKISEVSIGYTVTAKAEGSIPVTITIKKADEQKLVFDCTGNASDSFRGVAFEAAVAEEHNYILTVEWPEEKNGIEYAEGNRALVLTVSVKGEQID